MRELGIRGVRRGGTPVTTEPAKGTGGRPDPVDGMCAGPPARGRHRLRAHGQRLVRLHGVRRRRVRPSDRGMGVRHGHEHAGAAVAGVGAGGLMGRVPRRRGWSYPPRRPWHAVHRHGVHHQGYGIWDAAVDRHRRRLVRQRHGRKRRRRVQDRAGMAAQTLRGSEGPGIGDVPVGLVAGTRSACTGPWATGHPKRWKPSIINIKRHKPPHCKGGTKIRPLHLVSDV